jgi:oligopeptide transport system substrate-binding protein
MRLPLLRCLTLLACGPVLLTAGCGDPISAREGAKRKILLVNNKDDPRWLDLHRCNSVVESAVVVALFEGLVSEGGQNEKVAEPGVAERWEPNANKSIWTFHLRRNAKWSDGVPVTTKDFVWSWRRMLMPALAAEYSNMLFLLKNGKELYEGTVPPEDLGVKAIDDYTLEVTLTGPTPHYPQILCHPSWFPVPRHCIEKYGAITDALNPWTDEDKMVSNGPFKLKRYLFRQYLEVERNPSYWDAATVKLDGVRFYPIDSDQTEERLFRRGQLHLTYNVPLSKTPDYLRDHPDVVVNDDNLSVRFYRVNITRKPFTDVRVRRALGLALDRQSIVKNILRANQKPAWGLVPPMEDYEPVTGFSYNVAEAKRLLAEAGYPDGRGFPEDVYLLIAKSEAEGQVSEAVQAMWRRDLGITIKIKVQDYNAYLSSQQSMDYDITVAGWNADYYDAATFIDMWTTDGGNNRTGFSNAAFDKLVADAGQCSDAADRIRILREAEALILKEAPVIPSYFYTRTRLKHPSVVGWQRRLLDDRMWKYFDLTYPPPPCSMDDEIARD